MKSKVNGFYDFRVEEIFISIDNYANSKIQSKQLSRYFRRQRIIKTEFEIKQLINRIDGNQDGQIDFEEFRSAFIALDIDRHKEVILEIQKSELKNKTLKKNDIRVKQKEDLDTRQPKLDKHKNMMIEIVETF